jgi:hypothetical protein
MENASGLVESAVNPVVKQTHGQSSTNAVDAARICSWEISTTHWLRETSCRPLAGTGLQSVNGATAFQVVGCHLSNQSSVAIELN